MTLPASVDVETLRAIVDGFPGPIVYWDRDLYCRLANTAYREWWGGGEMVGRSMDDVLGPTIVEQNRPFIRGVLNGADQTFRRDLVRPGTGQHASFEVSYRPYRVGGEVVGFFAYTLDVTVRDASNETAEREAARKTRELFRLAIEAAPVAIVVVSSVDGAVELANGAFLRLFGYTRSELFRTSIHGILVGEDGVSFTTSKGEGAHSLPLSGRTKSGDVLALEVTVSDIQLERGTSRIGAFVDVTERLRAEAERTGLIDRLRIVEQMVDSSTEAILGASLDGTLTHWNRGAVKTFGYTKEEAIGRPYAEMMRSPEGPEDYAACMALMFENRGAGPLHQKRVTKSGAVVEVASYPFLVRDESGKARAMATIVVDETETRQAEAALRETNERLRAAEEQHRFLLEATTDYAMCLLDRQGNAGSWTPGVARLLGYSAEQFLGMNLAQLLPQDDAIDVPKLLAKVARTGRVELEGWRLRRDGSRFWANEILTAIRDPNGEVAGYAMVTRDLTERRHAAAEVERHLEIERSNRELSQFAYVASHDLQEPLRMVASYTELLAERYRGKLDERADKYIHYAVDGARRMQALVSELLEYSRVGSQGKPLRPTDLRPIVDRVLRTLAPSIERSGAVIDVRLPAHLSVLGDEVQLGQLFQNLLSNALKFRRPESARVEIGAEREGDHLRFSVRDDGIGIDHRHAGRIFEMFQRLHERGKYEGSGIGLAIAKRIVERHGGTIWFESEVGRGTIFFFTLRPGDET